MRLTTLCFLIKDDQVLLAMKKRGFGEGKWNGVGGKIMEGEDVRAAAVREAHEEIGVTIAPEHLMERGTLHFRFQENPEWEQICHIFIAREWNGTPAESEEMRPEWYQKNNLPFAAMWVDDPHWLPLVLAGKNVKGEFLFADGGRSLAEVSVNPVSQGQD